MSLTLKYLPIITFVLFPTTFLGTYIMAVLFKHVEPAFPYISDVGTYSPESCIFGQFINIGCVLLSLIVYLRYRHIVYLISIHEELTITCKVNKQSLWIGFAASLGLSLVANFQETNVKIIHFTGACFCFGLGTVYFWMQALISYQMYPYTGSKILAHVRAILSVICTIFFMVVLICGIIARLQFEGHNPRKWYPSDGGWMFHVSSTASEWIVAISFCFYILSFANEFHNISINHPPLELLEQQLIYSEA
uniref:Putative dna damage-regulated autophagy modulator protein 2 n=1 Tax=Xenopsylla cheopis TaxID=163159 RepID=A0A6M2DEG9_XENCH